MPLTKSRLSRRSDHIGSSGQTTENTPSLRVSLSVPLNTIGYTHIANTIDVKIRIPRTHLVATAWTSGGGDGEPIAGLWYSGAKDPIAGRGTRNEIYGNAMYGSGYGNYTRLQDGTYQYSPAYTIGAYNDSPENASYDRDFPHGWPPIPWGVYQGALGLEDLTAEDVPGTIPDKLSGDSIYPNTDDHYRRFIKYWLKQFEAKQGNQTYTILAEPATVDLLQQVLQSSVDQGGCGIEQVQPQWTQIWQPMFYNDTQNIQDPDLNAPFAAAYTSITDDQYIEDSKFYMWNVLQYYRGSSVALVSRSYDNVQSHYAFTGATYWGQSKMNTTGVDMTFLKCLNETIVVSVPIIDPTYKVIVDLSPGVIAGIVVGSVCGVVLLASAAYLLIRRRSRRAALKRSMPARPKEVKGIGIGEMPDDDSTATSYRMSTRHTHITQ